MRYLATSLLALAFHATLADAGEAVNGTWLTVGNGVIPSNASPIAVGQYPGGRSVYVCRGQTAQQVVAVGRVVQGSNVCVVVDGKRPAVLSNYDLLVAPVAPVAAAAAVAPRPPVLAAIEGRALQPAPAGIRRIQLERARALQAAAAIPGGLSANCSQALSAHHSEAAQSAVPKFGKVDSQSGAYVEEHYSDGYTLYHFSSGTVVVSPSNARAFCPLMVVYSNVQYGTPPPLPADPRSGAGWVEHHNDQLLAIIRKQVANDEATVNAIKADESARTGGDLFRQTDYLTGIADFYAANGP
jgi:hypothetical protein